MILRLIKWTTIFFIFSSIALWSADICPIVLVDNFYQRYLDIIDGDKKNYPDAESKAIGFSKLLTDLFSRITTYYVDRVSSDINEKSILPAMNYVMAKYPLIQEAILNPFSRENAQLIEGQFAVLIEDYHKKAFLDKLKKDTVTPEEKKVIIKNYVTQTYNILANKIRDEDRHYVTTNFWAVYGNTNTGYRRFGDHFGSFGAMEKMMFIRPYADNSKEISQLLLNIPIGEYGENFSRKILITYQITMELIKAKLYSAAKVIYKQNQRLLGEQTARSGITYDVLEEGFGSGSHLSFIANAPIESYIEGMYTFTQSIISLMATRVNVPGTNQVSLEDEALGLLEKILVPQKLTSKTNSSLMSLYSVMVPLGYVGPINHLGKYYKNSLVYKNGELFFTDQFVNFITGLKKQERKDFFHDFSGGDYPKNYSGRGCPLGFTLNSNGKENSDKKTDIDKLGEIFFKIFEIVNKNFKP